MSSSKRDRQKAMKLHHQKLLDRHQSYPTSAEPRPGIAERREPPEGRHVPSISPRQIDPDPQSDGHQVPSVTQGPALDTQPLPEPDRVSDSDEVYTLAEVCRLLKVSRSTVDRMDQDGELPGRFKVRGQVRYHGPTLRAHLAYVATLRTDHHPRYGKVIVHEVR